MEQRSALLMDRCVPAVKPHDSGNYRSPLSRRVANHVQPRHEYSRSLREGREKSGAD